MSVGSQIPSNLTSLGLKTSYTVAVKVSKNKRTFNPIQCTKKMRYTFKSVSFPFPFLFNPSQACLKVSLFILSDKWFELWFTGQTQSFPKLLYIHNLDVFAMSPGKLGTANYT